VLHRQVEHTVPEQRLSARFTWQRGHIFDEPLARALYALVDANRVASVRNVQRYTRRR
jgi:hypothetical protein